jgi:DNA polymerase-3 subunit alpha (Gram-positive type)
VSECKAKRSLPAGDEAIFSKRLLRHATFGGGLAMTLIYKMLKKNIEEIEFVIFDTETTGLDPGSGDRIIEIAGVRLKGSQRIGSFQSLINPHRPVSEGAFAVNRIRDDMLIGAPDIKEVLPKFMDFIKGSCLCSYNAGFDMGFLRNELRLIDVSLSEDIVAADILKMARRLLPGLERYALWFVADVLGIKKDQKHRAFADVEMTLAIFDKLKAILHEKGLSDFASFSHSFGMKAR